MQKYLDSITDEKLKIDAKAFMFQEAQHYKAHEKFFTNLREHGYQIDSLIGYINLVTYRILEPLMGPKLNLATTAGLEHYTALLAEIGLSDDFLKDAEPVMRSLFEWHAAEEIEHKSVAFDFLQHIDDSYSLRIKGMIVATLVLLSYSSLCTVSLLHQDGKLLDRKIWKEMISILFTDQALFPKSFKIMLRYFHPDFHPWKHKNESLATKVFKRLKSEIWFK